MIDEQHEEHRMYRLAKNRFTLLIISSIAVALSLVVISLFLYVSSGTAQVDLSRPGYSSVRDEVSDGNDDFTGFSSTGPIDKESLTQFEELYSKTANEATRTEVFHNDIISNEALRITGEDTTAQSY